MSGAAADALERLGGCTVGVFRGHAHGEVGGGRAEAWSGDQGLQRGLDLLGRSLGRELNACVERFDPTCVERLIAPEWEQELWHAVGKGAQHGSKPTVVDHDSATGHDAIVVGEADCLDAVVQAYGVAIDGGGRASGSRRGQGARSSGRRGRSTPLDRP
jgi:hypothetical protein